MTKKEIAKIKTMLVSEFFDITYNNYIAKRVKIGKRTVYKNRVLRHDHWETGINHILYSLGIDPYILVN